MRNPDSIAESVAFTKLLSVWFAQTGFANPELAVDFGDFVYGAKEIERSLRALLLLNPMRQEDAEVALEELGYIHALLFTDMKPHLAEIESRWQALEDQIVSLVPDDA